MSAGALKNKKKMATQTIDVVLPILKNRNGDILKEWYIEFSCFSENKNKMIRYRKTFNMNRITDAKKRQELGDMTVKKLTSDLQQGWRPWTKNNYIYKDITQYKEISKIKGTMKNDSNQITRLVSEFLGKREHELKKKSYATYVSKIRIFTIFLEKYPKISIAEISNEIILDFWKHLVKKKLDKTTCTKYKHVLDNFFKWLLDKQYIDVNPVFGLPIVRKTKDEAARPINKIDIKILLSAIKKDDPQLYLACMFQFYAAIRPGNELHGLKIRDLDFFNNRIVIVEENAKKRRRTVDMSQKLADICSSFMINKYNKDFYVFGRYGFPGTKKLGINTLTTRFNKFRDRLNLPKTYKFYSLKHTGGGFLLEAGASIEELRAHMGHTSILSTDHYIKRHFGNRNQRIIHDFPSPE